MRRNYDTKLSGEIISRNYDTKLSGEITMRNYELVYHIEQNVGIIGILTFPKRFPSQLTYKCSSFLEQY